MTRRRPTGPEPGSGPDWGVASVAFDRLVESVGASDLESANEAQLRYDFLDGVIREVLDWQPGQVRVEELVSGERAGFIDYLLRSGEVRIVVEAKRVGETFATPTRRRTLRLKGSVLGVGPLGSAIRQARDYALGIHATAAVATNGRCWCVFLPEADEGVADGTLFFPIDRPGDGEALFNLLARQRVESGSLAALTGSVIAFENRLLARIRDADDRVDRNRIADHIAPALDQALYADALLADVEQLRHSFVTTEARTRFDSLLGIYLADQKPQAVVPADRIRRGKSRDHLEEIVRSSRPSHAPPVTLIVGSVGAGKSTYLRHFETIAGRDALKAAGSHWIYVDFERMGPGDDPRTFMYSALRDYLSDEHPDNPTDWNAAIEPAYDDVISGLARGPLHLLFTSDKSAFKAEVARRIQSDYEAVAPYVDRTLRFLTKTKPCIVILDNIDLYEDDHLETTVLAEGLALSKRVECHVIICVRDTTFVAHKNDSSLNAYELRKLWLDPPPFREVLSRRLSHARTVLKNVEARIPLGYSVITLHVKDLSIFFDIVQRSLLSGPAGDLIEALANHNVRRGLELTKNFLTSGHIQADRAVKVYLDGDHEYAFPYHEVFKGSVLGQWKHFRETRADCINVFDSGFGSPDLQLYRLWLLQYLTEKARQESSVEVAVRTLVEFFGPTGTSEQRTIEVLDYLASNGLVRETEARDLAIDSVVAITKSGAYYARVLIERMAYVEEVMLDTPIYASPTWDALLALTEAVEREYGVERMKTRAQRIAHFLDYLVEVEARAVDAYPALGAFASAPRVASKVRTESDRAIAGAERNRRREVEAAARA